VQAGRGVAVETRALQTPFSLMTQVCQFTTTTTVQVVSSRLVLAPVSSHHDLSLHAAFLSGCGGTRLLLIARGGGALIDTSLAFVVGHDSSRLPSLAAAAAASSASRPSPPQASPADPKRTAVSPIYAHLLLPAQQLLVPRNARAQLSTNPQPRTPFVEGSSQLLTSSHCY
jgi:hypothetical protein